MAALPKDYAVIHVPYLKCKVFNHRHVTIKANISQSTKQCTAIACVYLWHSLLHTCMLMLCKITFTLYTCCSELKNPLCVKTALRPWVLKFLFFMSRTVDSQYIKWAWPQRPTPSNCLRTCYWPAILFYLTSSTFNILHQHTSSCSKAVYDGPLDVPYFICFDLWATNVVHVCDRQTLACI